MSNGPDNEFGWVPELTLRHSGGTAAICRDPDGSRWLVPFLEHLDLEADGEFEFEGDPREADGEELMNFEVAGNHTAINDVTVIGGRVLEGAIRVDVDSRADIHYAVMVHGGYWLAAAKIDSVFYGATVTFWDSNDVAVLAPLPDHVNAESIVGANETCPKCASLNWLLASVPKTETTSPNDAFFEEWCPGRRAAICQGCGYLEELPRRGAAFHFEVDTSSFPPEAELRRARAHSRDAAWSKFREKSGVAPLGLTSESSFGDSNAGWSGSEDEITQISLNYSESNGISPPVLNLTSYVLDEDDPERDGWMERLDLARSIAIQRRGIQEFWSEDPKWELDSQIIQRRAEQEVRELTEEEISIPVNGTPTKFSLLRHPLYWSSVGSVGELQVNLDGAGVDPESIALRSIESPEIQ